MSNIIFYYISFVIIVVDIHLKLIKAFREMNTILLVVN